MSFGQPDKTAEELVIDVKMIGNLRSTEEEKGVLPVQNGIGFGGDGAIDGEDGGIELGSGVASATHCLFKVTVLGLSVEQ